MNIKRIRQERNIQQKQFALMMGVSQPTVSAWQSGKKAPSRQNIIKMSCLFRVPIQDLLNDGKSADNVQTLGVDPLLMSMLTDLDEQQIQSVRAFVAGLRANRRK